MKMINRIENYVFTVKLECVANEPVTGNMFMDLSNSK